jgi:hypothetical protein
MSYIKGRLAVALAALALSGCSGDSEEPRGDLFLRSVLALEPGSCEIFANPDAPMLPFGILDTSFGGSYFAPLLVGNSLPNDARGASLRAASVRLQADGSDLTAFTWEGPGFVPPAKGGEPGWGAMFVELVPAGLVAPEPVREVRISAKVRVSAELAGGARVESSELTFPIKVCNGCLIAFPSDAVDLTTGRCVGESPAPPPCMIGQDSAMDCRLCANQNPRCHL